MFDSFSKPGYKAVTPAGFQLPRRTAGPDVIALGGIDAGKIDELKQMGFDGAGLLGAIWNNSDQALDNFNKTSKKCSS
ncbi:Thiamine-phosphate synthase [compost metagenome]